VVAPENWKTEKLPQICKFRSGKAHEQYVDAEGAFVLVNSKFISSDGQIRKFSSINRCLAKSGDVLMVMSDLPNGKALAKTYLVSEDNKFAVNQRVCSLSPYKDDSRFLFYALNRHPYFLAFDDGVSQTHLLNRVFLKCELTLPNSVKEQEAIAEALSDADAAIESLDALITKKRDVKQATMQQLLTGRTRLPGFTAAWNEVRLGDLGTCLRGVSYKGDSDLSDGDTPTTVRLLRSNNVQNSLIQFNDVQYVNHDCVSDEQILRRDDIVICMANGSKVLVGKTGLYKDSQDTRYTFGAFMACFRSSSDQAHAIFVRYLFLTKQYQDYISNLLAGSSINNLAPKSIESLLFNVPPVKEQEAIAEVLSAMDDELEALTEQVSKLRMVKEGMMQDLLTGKVRLV
jgi:type I restriction enzyme S subunit